MIHYHGTPIGGTSADRGEFFVGRHALVSFYRPDDIALAAEYCQSFVLDNGAFSHWKSGKGDINFREYAKWANSYARHPNFDWCLIPDKIDGEEADNKELTRRWQKNNYRAKGVPIWHLHESLEYLDYLIINFEWVAFGSSGEWGTPNTQKWWERMGQAMKVACDSKGRPRAKFHGLRMLNPKVFTQLPFSSADSTNAGVNSGSLDRFGMYKPPTRAQRATVIANRIEQHNSAPIWIPRE